MQKAAPSAAPECGSRLCRSEHAAAVSRRPCNHDESRCPRRTRARPAGEASGERWEAYRPCQRLCVSSIAVSDPASASRAADGVSDHCAPRHELDVRAERAHQPVCLPTRIQLQLPKQLRLPACCRACTGCTPGAALLPCRPSSALRVQRRRRIASGPGPHPAAGAGHQPSVAAAAARCRSATAARRPPSIEQGA